MAKIYSISDHMFKKLFKDPKNVRDFLKKALPQEIKKRLDFNSITIDPTEFISDEFKDGYSDIVVKAELKSKTGGKIPTDFYFILEHKTESKVKVFIQILKYMCFIWEEDDNHGNPMRVLIPIVFYHGKKDWDVPGSFIELFDVDDEVKEFLLDFKYILFDANPWDFRDESNKELKDNVFLFTSMVLMKSAYKNDIETVQEIFRFWRERGFSENKEMVLLLLVYISQTQGINRDQLRKMLDASNIDGGEIMQTLAQQMKEEFRDEFLATLGPQLKNEGEKEGKKETAKQMLLDNLPIEKIAKYTGLTEKEIKGLMH